jgi:hypothetical protein
MNNNQTMSAQESLDLISKSILATKHNWSEQSFFYYLWGVGIALACFLNYALIQLQIHSLIGYIWMAVIAICVGMSIYKGSQQNTNGSITWEYELLTNVWKVIGVSFFITMFISSKFNLSPSILSLMLCGMGTTISGTTMKFKPLIYGGIVLFISSMICIFIPMNESLLVNGFALILGYLIPAKMLSKNIE